MPRKPRILTPQERKNLQAAILAAVPGPKRLAITRPTLLRKLSGLLRRNRIPVTSLIRELHGLRGSGKLRIATRVGMWRGGKYDPDEGTRTAKGAARLPQRRIRRVVAFVCTTCFEPFPSKAQAKAHRASRHGDPGK